MNIKEKENMSNTAYNKYEESDRIHAETIENARFTLDIDLQVANDSYFPETKIAYANDRYRETERHAGYVRSASRNAADRRRKQ